jgi:hypothetical protein
LSYTANILAVGGGGSTSGPAGGGGGGQVSYNAAVSLTAQTYTVTVGGAGQASSFGSVVTATYGQNGTSGAGGTSGSGKTGGGGNGVNAFGGGAGDSANGSSYPGNGSGGQGGAGTSNSISGSAVTYGAGGGGYGSLTPGLNGNGGSGAGPANTGTGGSENSSGGSGIVIVSWVTANFPTVSITGAGNVITTSGANSIATFIINGTLSFPNIAYWVGGSGNWDASTQTNWSYTSGGISGAAIPTTTTPVYFNANSGTGTVTISATANCLNLTTTGSTVNITGSNALNVYGNLTLSTSVLSSYTGTLSFLSTSTGQTITVASNNLGTVVFNGSGGAWTLQDSWSCGNLTITTGTVNFNGKNITSLVASNAGTLTTGNGTLSFTSFTNTGTLTLGSGTITLTGTGTVWTGGGTFTANTSTIVISDTSSSSKTFAGAGLTYYNVTFTGGTGVHIVTGSNTFNALTITTPPTTINFIAGTTQTMSANNFNVSGTAGNLNILQSTSAGSAWYLAQSFTGNVVCDYISLQDSHVI